MRSGPNKLLQPNTLLNNLFISAGSLGARKGLIAGACGETKGGRPTGRWRARLQIGVAAGIMRRYLAVWPRAGCPDTNGGRLSARTAAGVD